jgi:6-pyruvoyltetrahydropterin/6-carboxytetrahydropterin synthase
MRIERKYSFSAAHQLSHLSEGHKCARLHGHTYHVVVVIEGPVDPATGFVLDFADIDSRWKTLIHPLVDHRFLNEVEGLPFATSEHLAVWIYGRLQESMQSEAAWIQEIVVSETPYSCARYTRP